MTLRRRTLLAGLAAGAALKPAFAQQAPLLKKPIPSTGELVPIIGLGSARRYEEARTEADMAPLRDTFRRFHELGGTVVDTAPSYGNAEGIMGDIMANLGIRRDLFVCTKVGVDNIEQGRAQIADSFRKLRTERIDLIAVHNLRDITNELAYLRELKQAGRIRYVGATTSFDRQYEAFEAMMRRETLDSIQIDYALDNRNAAERIIPLAAERGMAVFINLPFGRGSVFRATEGKTLPAWATEIDVTTWAQFMLKYLVSHPAVTCAVPGMAQARYVEDNLNAARGRMPDAAMRRRMEQFIDGL
ncbi:aldo/keto reductase [Neoroseomonas oryzicola]|uniref:Aldo/keto reductase n=1 Tax=Neoroseomonas oryzicola TaxID=535904 RepID=A0A9X9WBU5_9PROT|nr:aldo/keto reductase [Neoroseomonas oryzicola]MBR0657805.1 aldo/keto reductase [Neoroseomonas oryzicola]NKE18627.1 aldo/keto reductase [Neoroseomonas oryzicola]